MSEYSQHILQQVASFIQHHRLLESASGTLYVGLSGGPDSVALLHILSTLLADLPEYKHLSLTALHCNFHLRGIESDRDQQFCLDLCSKKLNIPLLVKQFDTCSFMQEQHLSLEMAARQLRYEWWATLTGQGCLGDTSSPRIALGHHQDDSIENVLMNLMRGTGIQGLTGIVPYNAESHVIRPLLCLSRQEILQYLDDNGLGYVTDSTNAENDTLRNQVRNQLLPLMTQILPQSRHGICVTMHHLMQSAQLSQLAISQYVNENATRVSTDGFEYEILKNDGQYSYQLEQHYLQRGYQFDGIVAVPIGKPLPQSPVQDSSINETFDKDKIQFPLRWRRWQVGDRMAPLGMNGHTKLLSDLFANAHYLPIQKQLSWILEDASGTILWVPGLRMSHLARVTPETTQPITICYGDKL